MGSITEADADALYQSMVGKNYAPATIGRHQTGASVLRGGNAAEAGAVQPVPDSEGPYAGEQGTGLRGDACDDPTGIGRVPRCRVAVHLRVEPVRWTAMPQRDARPAMGRRGLGRNRVRIRKHKTAARIIPLFRELRPYLEEAFDAAAPGAEYVISRYRDSNMNLRTQAERILDRAGVVPWPKLFHNCRATRQSELVREFPISDVCYWIGNSVVVAAKHYLQRPNDAAYERAIGAPQSAAKSRSSPCSLARDTMRQERRNPWKTGVFSHGDVTCLILYKRSGTPCRTRTYNPLIKSQMLCRLS